MTEGEESKAPVSNDIKKRIRDLAFHCRREGQPFESMIGEFREMAGGNLESLREIERYAEQLFFMPMLGMKPKDRSNTEQVSA